ncbi:hypothetical protein [Micromonospora chokoriensis]|uniref:hypothetical protein n=1 Tax=Micromonospora chokoriensis TaxID=356851 RepID=UPI000B290C2F|nr:hypothetical protein [Micromonospora chokoriensis]
MAITSSLSLVSHAEAQAALGEKTHAPLASDERDQLVLGRVAWQPPPEPLDGGYFAVFLIDKRTNRKPNDFGVSAPQEAVSLGSAGVENRIAERYAWLRGAGDVKVGDHEWRSNGNRLGVFDETASPLTFVARFPYLADAARKPTIATAPVGMSDLLLALVYLGPDGQVYWAQRLQG